MSDDLGPEDNLALQEIAQKGLNDLLKVEGLEPMTELDFFEGYFDGLPMIGLSELGGICEDVLLFLAEAEDKQLIGKLYFWRKVEKGLTHFVRRSYSVDNLRAFVRLARLRNDQPS